MTKSPVPGRKAWAFRNRTLLTVWILLATLCLQPAPAPATDACAVLHPLSPPDTTFTGRCPNCGMTRAMWARTWKTFTLTRQAFTACSFHCMADMARKAGVAPENVTVSLYLHPSKAVPAEEAVFVVGSRAPGTMTLTSKAAFQETAAAQDFINVCGGRQVDFANAYQLALADVTAEKAMIARKRIASGKIVEPAPSDECKVCAMFPARYPKNKCQIRWAKGPVYHFCSTQCLFRFLANPGEFSAPKIPPVEAGMIWVVDYPSGNWISARTAYCVVGANAWGPMGREAFCFDRIAQAEEFTRSRGGRILTFGAVNTEAIHAVPGTP